VNVAMEKAAKKIAASAANKLTSQLREMAYRAEWPSDIIVQLSVKAEGENLYISYPDSLNTQIENLEYGTPDTAPTAVIRPFMARYAENLETEVSESIVDILSNMGAFN